MHLIVISLSRAGSTRFYYFHSPGFGAEDAGLEFDLVLQAGFLDGFSQISGIGGGAAQDGGFQVGHKLQLPVGVAGGQGQGQTAHLVGTAVKTGAAGKQTVAVGYLDNIFLVTAGCDDGTGAAILPQVNIVLGDEPC